MFLPRRVVGVEVDHLLPGAGEKRRRGAFTYVTTFHNPQELPRGPVNSRETIQGRIVAIVFRLTCALAGQQMIPIFQQCNNLIERMILNGLMLIAPEQLAGAGIEREQMGCDNQVENISSD